MPIYPAGAARRAAVSAWGAARHASGRLEGGPRGSSRTARGPAGAERRPPRLSRGPGRRLARLSQPQPSCLSPAALHGAIGLSLSCLAARLAYTVRLLRPRSEEHTSELQSLMRTSYAVLCLKKKTNKTQINIQ